MHPDILHLLHFYRTSLGRVAQMAITRQLQQLWPQNFGQRLLGLGYATPYLEIWDQQAERCAALMPATMGVAAWPEGGKNLAVLADERELPFEDYSLDRVLVVHGLEGASDANGLLQEVWRVLSGQGEMILIVPSRMGLWARFEHTPFGNGQPYGSGQLHWLLQQNLFTPIAVRRALFTPPTQSAFWLRQSPWLEKFGAKLCQGLGGVLIIQARKEVYQAHPLRYRQSKKPGLLVPGTYLPKA
jgi:SAM-dependent methyltransferase